MFDGEEFCYACGYIGEPVEYGRAAPNRKRDMTALLLAIVPGFFGMFGLFDVYGLGHLYLRRYVRAALFLTLSIALFLAVRLSYVDRDSIFLMAANSAVFLIQAFDVLRILNRERAATVLINP